MEKITAALLGVIVVAILLTLVNVAYAETYDVDVSLSGFYPSNSTINQNDSIRYTHNGTGYPIGVSAPLVGGYWQIDAGDSKELFYNSCGQYTITEEQSGLTMLLVVTCPPPVVVDVVPTNSTSTTIVEGTVDASDPVVDDETFAEEIAKEEEDKRVSATNETLGFRLQILQVLENILAILFGE